MWWGAQQPAPPPPQPEPPPPEQGAPHQAACEQVEVPAAPAVCSPNVAERSLAQPDEEARLRASLAQREAALLRQEGENYLLGAQVQQLEQRAEEVGRDAQLCVAQLAQALQLLESVNTRAPLKAEVDRARALVASARRGLGRVAGLSSKGLGGDNGIVARGGGLRPPGAADRRSAPRGRPRSPRGRTGPGPQRPSGESAGLAASAAAAVTEAVPNGVTGASGGGSGATTPGFPPRRARGGEDGQRSLRGTSKSGGTACEKEQRMRRAPPGPMVGLAAPASVRAGGSSVASLATEVDEVRPQEAAAPQSGAEAPAPDGPPGAEPAPDVQQQFLRQRVLLAHALRKSASLQDELSLLRDDLTRKDVIIHGLRQEIQAHRQEVDMQHQQFEQQQQQLQQLRPV
mmetsp:Transcript_84305/g.233668  ORF Transcript_84305/g.233668 Transcript_84305/m.233668 type:complete len:401 (-) Transcript_84305:6-1208(-)